VTVFEGLAMKYQLRQRGFTLVEVMIVIVILLTLMSLLLAVLWSAVISTRKTSTTAMLSELCMELEHFAAHQNGASYPIKPGGNGLDSNAAPDFYQTPCAPLGSKANGSEDNSALLTLLQTQTHFHVKTNNVVNNRLVDDFGSPVIVRFLVLNTANGKVVKVVAWSYGHDGINNVNATPVFANATPPGDDQAEFANINASLRNATSDDPSVVQ
jgi:prepilin-type N-terminal cleavage/methylation domain-containing protein